MNDWLTGVVVALGGVTCVVLAIGMVRDVEPQDRSFALLGIVELAVVVQLVVGAVALAHTDRDVNGVLFVSYLVGNIVAVPIGAFWSLAERSRSGTGVLLVAVLTVMALQVRLESIWAGAGA